MAVNKYYIRCGQCQEDNAESKHLFNCGHLACQTCFRRLGTCNRCNESIESSTVLKFGTFLYTVRISFTCVIADENGKASKILCKACQKDPVRFVISDCGHMVCVGCNNKVKRNEKCPLCDQTVTGRQYMEYQKEDILA